MDQRKQMVDAKIAADELNARSKKLLLKGLALKRTLDRIKKRNARLVHVKKISQNSRK